MLKIFTSNSDNLKWENAALTLRRARARGEPGAVSSVCENKKAGERGSPA
jgi:hypothetical protein